ncbi:Proliferation-associated protein 2G4 [Plecturocebus cupreus]
MSATGDPDPSQGDQEVPVSQEGVQVEAAGAGNQEGGDSGPNSGDVVPTAEAAGAGDGQGGDSGPNSGDVVPTAEAAGAGDGQGGDSGPNSGDVVPTAEAAGAGDGQDGDSGPNSGDVVPTAEAAGAGDGQDGDSGPNSGNVVPTAEAAGDAGPMGGLRVEEGEQAAGLAAAPRGWSAEEESDTGPAEEEGNVDHNLNSVMVAHPYTLTDVRVVLFHLLYSLFRHLHHNNHIVRGPRHYSRLMRMARAHAHNGLDEPLRLLAPQRLGVGIPGPEGDGLGLIQEAASVPEPVVPADPAEMAREPGEELAEEAAEGLSAEESAAEEPAAEEAIAREGEEGLVAAAGRREHRRPRALWAGPQCRDSWWKQVVKRGKHATLYQPVSDRRSEIIDVICKPTDEWLDKVLLHHSDWSAMARFRLTITSAYWVRAIFLPQPPKHGVSPHWSGWSQTSDLMICLPQPQNVKILRKLIPQMRSSDTGALGKNETFRGEVTKSQPEKWDEEAQDAADKEKKEQENDKDVKNKLGGVQTQNLLNGPSPIPNINAHPKAINLVRHTCVGALYSQHHLILLALSSRIEGAQIIACGREGKQRQWLRENEAASDGGRKISDEDKQQEQTIAKDLVMTKYKMGGNTTNKVLRSLVEAYSSDAMIMEETGKVFKKKKEMKKGVAFPTSISVNNCVCHFSPLKSDQDYILKEGKLVKIDFGVHVDGFITNVAHTFVVDVAQGIQVTGRKADVIKTTHLCAEAALHLVRPGNQNTQETEAQNKAAHSLNCAAIEGMLSNQLKQHVIDGGKNH